MGMEKGLSFVHIQIFKKYSNSKKKGSSPHTTL